MLRRSCRKTIAFVGRVRCYPASASATSDRAHRRRRPTTPLWRIRSPAAVAANLDWETPTGLTPDPRHERAEGGHRGSATRRAAAVSPRGRVSSSAPLVQDCRVPGRGLDRARQPGQGLTSVDHCTAWGDVGLTPQPRVRVHLPRVLARRRHDQYARSALSRMPGDRLRTVGWATRKQPDDLDSHSCQQFHVARRASLSVSLAPARASLTVRQALRLCLGQGRFLDQNPLALRAFASATETEDHSGQAACRPGATSQRGVAKGRKARWSMSAHLMHTGPSSSMNSNVNGHRFSPLVASTISTDRRECEATAAATLPTSTSDEPAVSVRAEHDQAGFVLLGACDYPLPGSAPPRAQPTARGIPPPRPAKLLPVLSARPPA